ncbi:phosphoribosyltransferase family protein [Halorubrum depositum]|uniref:phosphoribosyltransferase family protein n=1 Tax=Halorubrum depositum TaxID=2583992 RepID=UPI0011A253F7|nr:phosphoribosyltransferase family protein [Halorubrum depositum]
MNYRSVADLNADTRRLARASATDADLIVGIPRSGLLVANLLCLYLDVPMTDVDGLCEGDLIDTGDRYDGDRTIRDVDSVLVVDDSVRSGGQMTETRERLEAHDFPFDVSYGAIYVSPWGHEYVDHWVEVVPTPRVFEWNVMHHPMLQYSCVDIDGVLCRDPTPEENDDGERYREFLADVEPNVVPNQRIGHLVTSRLEQYRPETERWLDEHGIRYDSLVMMDLPSKRARQERGNHARHKADAYDSTDAPLFIESDPRQAAAISRRTGKPVFCYETQEMVRPGHAKRTYRTAERAVSKFKEDPVAFPVSAGKFLYYRGYHLVSKLLP